MHPKIKQALFYKYQVNEAIDNYMCLSNVLYYSPLKDFGRWITFLPLNPTEKDNPNSEPLRAST